ncbi:hypothetical protein EYR40_007628 [Pleurotus pulmonarius]|nr:hypothetical protein EYR38_008071 [Pleurotus pulmonarius]KAF4597177.1 hypothetical protein EYR40_007628 [Pleurotus pulmonarius]
MAGPFDLIIGVLLIGLFFNTYLYGLVTYQFIVYSNTKFSDPQWIKIMVGVLFVIDTIHTAVGIYMAWDMCVTNYGNPASLLLVSWAIPFTACATSVVAIISQFLLGHRAFLLTKSYILAAAIGVLSILGFIFGMIAGIKSGIAGEVSKFGPLKPYVICWLGFQTAADLLITASLSFVLSQSKTGFRRTDTIINRLIRGAVQTGLFVAIFALADLFSFVLHGDTNFYAMFAYPIGRIYTNTLLDTLNARADLKNMTNTIDMDSESNANAFRMNNSHTLHSVQIQKEVISDTHFDGTDSVFQSTKGAAV